jgi:hypothetical protein
MPSLLRSRQRPTRPARDGRRKREQQEQPEARPSRWPNKVTLAALVTVVALVTGGVNLVFLLWPSLKSDPGLQHSAQIAVLAMDKNVTYRNYLQRPASTPATPPPDPSVYGNVFYLQMEMEGFKGKRAKLRWFTYDANNGARLPRPFSTGHKFKAKAPTHKSISQEWVQLPPDSGTYKIRFELYDGGDVLLAFADTAQFTTVTLPAGG